MARLKDLLDKNGEFYEAPPLLIQTIEPADYIAETILEHMRYGYVVMSMTALNTGPHGGRLLIIFQHSGQ